MSRQMMDGVIILAVLVLGATHLYALAERKVIRANQVAVVASNTQAMRGPGRATARAGAWSSPDTARAGSAAAGTATVADGRPLSPAGWCVDANDSAVACSR